MSVGADVDALALMLDGAVVGLRSLSTRAGESTLESFVAQPEWAEVAEAILELEAWADWYNSDHCTGRPGRCGDLAGRAKPAIKRMAHPQFEYLEAAASLRDGWRPRAWRRKGQR